MKYLIGNWKLQLTEKESVRLAEAIVSAWKEKKISDDQVRAVVCASHVALAGVEEALSGSAIALGAQDVFWEEKGAYTGEIAPKTLAELGCSYCLVGHSERRQYLGETDEMARKKTAALLRAGINPVVCVGETLDERQAGRQDGVVISQVRAALGGISPVGNQRLLIAYEPRWAIGTGRAASWADAVAMHGLIRDTMLEILPPDVVKRQCAVLYGGSVDSKNIKGFLAAPNVDGVLAGGASLKAQEFAAMATAF